MHEVSGIAKFKGFSLGTTTSGYVLLAVTTDHARTLLQLLIPLILQLLLLLLLVLLVLRYSEGVVSLAVNSTAQHQLVLLPDRP